MPDYDPFSTQYAALIRSRDEWGFSPYLDLVVPALLQIVGDIAGQRVLDACCGEGYVTRLLADRGAQVLGIDISSNLIALARQKEQQEPRGIEYRVHDLCQPLPALAQAFDVIVCNMGLNDVREHASFIASLSQMLAPTGRIVLSLNNPYSAVMRDKVKNYFDSGQSGAYAGLTRAGVPVPFYHRTFEEYLHAFARQGLYLRAFSDCRPSLEHLQTGSPRAERYYRFPFFMVLELFRPG